MPFLITKTKCASWMLSNMEIHTWNLCNLMGLEQNNLQFKASLGYHV